jgi:hypothetical protein
MSHTVLSILSCFLVLQFMQYKQSQRSSPTRSPSYLDSSSPSNPSVSLPARAASLELTESFYLGDNNPSSFLFQFWKHCARKTLFIFHPWLCLYSLEASNRLWMKWHDDFRINRSWFCSKTSGVLFKQICLTRGLFSPTCSIWMHNNVFLPELPA